jgi:hypothetical protein
MINVNEIPDGIHTDISIGDYHANRTHVSATSLKQSKRSLKQFDWHRRGIMPKSDGNHFSFGNAFELALLDKKGFENEVAIMQDEYWIALANEEYMKEKGKTYSNPRQSARYQAEKSRFIAANDDKYIITDKGDQSFECIEHMLTSCYSDSTIQKLIEGTEYQLSLFWTDPETGLKLKTRPDICKRKKNVIVNLKTAVDGSPSQFSRDLAKYDYPLQACLEIKGCIETGLMEQVDNYFWLVVEKEAPYNATIYEFQKSDIQSTNMELEYYITKIKQAQDKNLWPGYSDQADNKHGILTAKIPSWYTNF